MDFQVHYKEKIYYYIMVAVSLLIYGYVAINRVAVFENRTFLILSVLGLIVVFLNFLGSIFLIGTLKCNAIEINENQLPEVYEILKSHCKKLDFTKIPKMYVMQGNGVLNAFAMKFARHQYVILYSSILDAAYQEGLETVSFVVGHEVGHLKRNHAGFLNLMLTLPARLVVPFLGNAHSRACEYTCDNIGYNLCPQGACKGLLVLAVGKNLHKKISINELISNTKRESGFYMFFAEVFLTHPALVKRIAVINNLKDNNLTVDDLDVIPFVSPKIDDVKQKDLQ